MDLERRRVPLERKISLKFKEFRGFITEYSQNLSMGGMFIRTTSPKPVGTIFDFELSLTDDFKLVQGIGEVIWVRERDDGAERPSGMGVRFLDLSSESRRLIQRIVEEQVAHGGTPFELEPPGFPPPPLRQAPPAAPRPGAQSTLFHATAAPVAPVPPLPSRPPRGTPQRAAPPATSTFAPASAATPPPAPLAPTPVAPAGPPRRAPLEIDSFPDLGPPELPVPELAAHGDDLLPDLGDSLEGETVEGIELVDAEELPPAPLASPPHGDVLPDLHDVHDDPTLLRPSAAEADEDAASAHSPSPSPWAAPTPPQPAAGAFAAPGAGPRGRWLPSGFDEVARAFGEPAADEELPGETLRMPPLAPLPEPARPVPVPPTPIAPSRQPAAPSASPLAAPERRPPRRRRSWLPLVVGLLLLLIGGFGVLYLRFPELLPEWAGGTRPVGAANADGGAPPPASGGGAAYRVAPRPAAPAAAAPAGPASATSALGPATAGLAPPVAPSASTPPAAPAGPQAAPAPNDADAAARAALGSDAPRSRFTSVEEIWGQRSPLGTVVTIVTNGSVPEGAFSHFRLEGGNPREVIRLRGVDDRYRRPSVPVSTGEVKQVRLGYHAKPEGNELHVVIDLASPRVKLLRATPVDNRLELLLAVQ
jgi:uncharacterized protein (TIGR02266 family)